MIDINKTIFDLERIRLNFTLIDDELGPDNSRFIEQAFNFKKGTVARWREGRFASWAEFSIFRLIIGRGWLVTEEWIKRFGHTCCGYKRGGK